MRKEIKTLAAVGILVVVAAVLGARYYRETKQGERRETKTADSRLVRPDSPALGPADAPVTVVEFVDPECESCAAFHPTLKRILKDYEGKVRLVVRYMPLHPNSLLAANYTEGAGEQGKYWEMQELLFRRQSEWGEIHGHGPQIAAAAARREPAPVLFDRYASELGLDVERVRAAIQENCYAAKVERDMRDGQGLGVRQTPTFFVNGRMLMRFGEAPLRALIDEELKK
jgi:protein-disulfide isomerase